VPVWKGGYLMTPRAVSVETCRVLSRLLKESSAGGVGELSSSLLFGGQVALELEENAREAVEGLLREISGKRLPLPGPRLMIVERFSVEDVVPRRFLKSLGEALEASRRFAVTVLLYPFGERISNTLALPLWEREDVRLIVPKSLGMLVKHSTGFDPYTYLLRASESELRRRIRSTSNPYTLALSYEMKRSFGHTKLREALSSELVLDESARQASARFYDVEGALKLLKWIRHGCVKVIRREAGSVKELHPLTLHIFRADTFFY